MKIECSPEEHSTPEIYQAPVNAQAQISLSNGEAPSKDSKTRTVEAAKIRFSLKEKKDRLVPFKEQYRFKDWLSVMTASRLHLYKRVIKAEYKASLRWKVIQKRDAYAEACFQQLKENFQNYLQSLRQKDDI